MQVRLVDANSLGYAQHCANDLRHGPDGLQTQAVAGMLKSVANSLRYEPAVLNLLVWDGRAQWRYDLHPGYKAGRHKTVEQREMRAHYERARPFIQKALRMLPVLQVGCAHAEADDVAFGLSRQLSEQGHLVSLRTADADWLQMVNARCRWENARKAGHVVELDGFAKSSGYASPGAVPMVKALMGDTSDDIDGLPDVGDKRAASLVAKYGSLEAVLRASEDVFAFSQEPKHFHSLMLPEYRELVARNWRLVNLAGAPRIEAADVRLEVGEFESLDLYELFVDLGLVHFTDTFSWWERAAQQPLPKADVLSVRRALSAIGESWLSK